MNWTTLLTVVFWTIALSPTGFAEEKAKPPGYDQYQDWLRKRRLQPEEAFQSLVIAAKAGLPEACVSLAAAQVHHPASFTGREIWRERNALAKEMDGKLALRILTKLDKWLSENGRPEPVSPLPLSRR